MGERQLEKSSLALNIKYDTTARQAWMEAAESRQRTEIAVFVAILAALVAVSVYLFFYRRNKMLRLEHENDVLKIQNLKDNLFESNDRNKNMSSRISELFKTRFKFIDSLAASYFECRDTPRSRSGYIRRYAIPCQNLVQRQPPSNLRRSLMAITTILWRGFMRIFQS